MPEIVEYNSVSDLYDINDADNNKITSFVVNSFDNMKYTCDISIDQIKKELDENVIHDTFDEFWNMQRKIRNNGEILTLNNILYCKKLDIDYFKTNTSESRWYVSGGSTDCSVIYGVKISKPCLFTIEVGGQIIFEKYCDSAQVLRFEMVPMLLLNYYQVVLSGSISDIYAGKILPVHSIINDLKAYYKTPRSLFGKYSCDDDMLKTDL